MWLLIILVFEALLSLKHYRGKNCRTAAERIGLHLRGFCFLSLLVDVRKDWSLTGLLYTIEY